MTCSYLMAQDQALQIWNRKLSIAVVTSCQLSIFSVQSILRFKWPSPWEELFVKDTHEKKQEENSAQSRCSSVPRAWEAVKPETKLWSVPATRTRRRQRSTYQNSLCHHGRPTIRVPYTLGFPPKHWRTVRTARYRLQKTGFCPPPFHLFELEEWCSEGCHFHG